MPAPIASRPVSVSVFASIENPHFLSIFDESDKLLKTKTQSYYFNEMPSHRRALGWKIQKNSRPVPRNPISYLRTIHAAFQSNCIVLLGIGTCIPWLPLTGILAILLNKRLIIASEGLKKPNTNQVTKVLLKLAFNNKNITFLAIGTKADQDFRALGLTKVRYYKFGFAEAPYEVLPKKTKPSKAVCILSVGQLIDRKNFQSILESLSRYRGDTSVIYKIAGDGPLRSTLKNLARTLPQGIKVELLGNQSKEELAVLFAQADLFALPSKYDGWGVVVNQAIANSVPTIVSEGVRSGRNFLVEDNFNGAVFQCETQLDQALHKLIEESDERKRLSRNCSAIWNKWKTDEIARRLGALVAEENVFYCDDGPLEKLKP